MDEMDLGTRSYSVYVTNSDVVIGFWVFWWYFDHFLYKIYVVKGSDTCHNTYFRDEYNLSPVQGSYGVLNRGWTWGYGYASYIEVAVNQ